MTRCAAAAIGVVILAATAAAETHPQRFRLAGKTVTLAPGETAGELTVTVLATFPNAAEAGPDTATLVDVTPGVPGVTVTATPVKGTHELRQVWRFPVAVKGLPKAASQERVFLISYGELQEEHPYTLSNTRATPFAWSLKAAPDWNVGTTNALRVAVRVGDVTATRVTLQQAELTSDDKLKRTLGTDLFMLCDAATDPCTPPGSLSPGQAHALYLRPRTPPLPAGVYKGNVSIGATEKTEHELLAVTLYSPLRDGALLGILALSGGVLLSLVLLTVRSWMQNQREKEVIALLRKRLDATVVEFEALPANLKQAARSWRSTADTLTAEILAVTDLVRKPYPSVNDDEVASFETFKSAIEARAATAVFLRRLVRDGLQKVAAIQEEFPEHPNHTETAARQIAAIDPAEDVPVRIRTILETLEAAVQPVADPRARFRIVLAAAWALISVLTGFVLLVLQNPGFGTELDFLYCFLWALGVSAIGQSATNLTPAGIAGSIGVKLPGAK
jgi:hypothetical protein